GGLVSAAGTTFSTQGGAVSVTAPAGAVTQTSSVTVGPAANAPANVRLLPGTAFDFGPASLTFAQPVTITIKYDPSNVAAGSPESGLQLYEAVAGKWTVVAGSTVNLTAKTVSGAVSHLGTYSVMMQPKVETVTISGDQPAIPVVTTRQLTATLKDNEGTTLTRPVAWSSSDPTILSVDASSGLATAKVPGSVTITAASEGKSGTATVTVIPGPPSKIVVNAGNNQSVAAGAVVPVAPSVKVTDAGDNPIANVAVVFVVASGGGSITGASATTNASGIATLGSWTLGPNAGPNSLTVTSPAISGVSLTFLAAGGAGPAANVAIFSGNGQTGTAGGNIPNPPQVKVTDANGNFVAGFAVTFTPGPNSGSVTGGSVVTDASGIATVGSWKLGSTPGAQTLIAAASGLAGSPITINATAVAPVPGAIAVAGGDNQTARPGLNVPTSPSFRVTDPSGVPVPGVTVTFVVTEGGGSVSSPTAVTNTDGIVQVTWTLGPSLGPNTLQASIPGGIPAVVVHATAAAPPPTRIAINAGDAQSANAGSAVPIAPSVKVTDADGIGVGGVSVTFSIRSGGGSLTGASVVTNAQGIATVGSWTLGLGGNSIFASVPGLAGDPVIFVALGTADVQIVTFGDSNTDLGFAGTSSSPRAGSYVSSTNPAIKLDANAPNDTTQLAGKIESRWRANRSTTIKAVNHGISGTGTTAGRSILLAPSALTVVNGVTRFRGEVLGDAYPWSGGEPVNAFYPNGAILRVQAFKPRSSDFGYISTGTNDLDSASISTTMIRNNLEIMIDEWISRGLAPNRLMITTLPPKHAGAESSRIPDLNSKIRTLALAKGIRLIDISQFVSNDDGLTWKSASMHVTNDELHYSESVRAWIADQVASIMLQLNP
ncbi:MAG TPA: SGNH/GDSL hydrolase family protein, partial [Gemmatimonadaceae bacterium]|nr:SGNH/GDSL hydrolase family protein [Gemmatimonadaceae bacterium]